MQRFADNRHMLTNKPPMPTPQEIAARMKDRPGALLPILHEIQDSLGYIPTEAVADIAQQLNLSRAEVHGVITFYHHFHQEPTGSNVLQVCRAEACQAMGGDPLWAHACKQVQGGTAAVAGGAIACDAVTLLPVYCLGLCSSSPAVSWNGQVHARMDAAKLDRLLATANAGGAA